MNRRQACLVPSRARTGQGHEEEHERHGKAVVEACLHVQGLSNLHGHARAVHDDLPEPGIRRGEDGGQDAGLPEGESGKEEQRAESAQEDGQQHPRAQQPHGQIPDALQKLEVGAAGIGEKQQHEADFGDPQPQSQIHLALPQLGHQEEHQHSGGGEHNRGRQQGPLHAAGNQAVEQKTRR